MYEEIQNNVATILENAGVKFDIAHRGLRKNPFNEKDCVHETDEWLASFSVGNVVREFQYFTGLGLREPATAKDKQRAAFNFPGLSENDKKGRTIYGKNYLAEVQKKRRPKAPNAADVLNSLIRDGDAENMSFDEWCNDYGYDNDSRKAEATFDACRKNMRELRDIIKGDVMNELAEALEDY